VKPAVPVISLLLAAAFCFSGHTQANPFAYLPTAPFDGWSIADPAGNLISPEYLYSSYSSSTVPYYVHGSLGLKGFTAIEIEIYSDASTHLEFLLQDENGYTFRAVKSLPGGTVGRVQLSPSDFRSDPEETLVVRTLNPDEASEVLLVYDVETANAFIPRKNKLIIHDLTVRLPQIPVYEGILRVRDELILSDSWEIRGDIIIEKGARLIFNGADIRIAGRIIAFGGELSVKSSRVVFLQSRGFEHGITVHRDGSLKVTDSRLVSVYPIEISSMENSRIHLRGVRGSNSLRFLLVKGSFLEGEDSLGLGEIRFDLTSRIELRNIEDVRIWLPAAENVTGEWSLPAAGRVEAWTGDGQFPLSLTECRDIGWGLRLYPGVGGYLRKAELDGIEIIISSGIEAYFSGIRNSKLPPGRTLQSEHYQLRFGEKVQPGNWNFRAENGSSLVIRNSSFGSAVASGRDTTLTLINSDSDALGYLISELGSSAFIERSSLASPLVATSGGRARVFNSRLSGRVIAENGGTVMLRETVLRESVEVAAGARVSGNPRSIDSLDDSSPSASMPPALFMRIEMGGIGTFLPRITGLEEYENMIIPYFELNILRRFYVRFPEFEYVVLRSGMPRYSTLSVRTTALFERTAIELGQDEEEDPVLYRTPLSFELSAGARTRVLGPLWFESEIAADPSARAYSGFRIYSGLSVLRSMPEKLIDAELFTGVQFANDRYIETYYPGLPNESRGLSAEFISYGGRVLKELAPEWLVNISANVENRIGPAAERLIADEMPFTWNIIIALIYRIQ
jgi:hypothetical protein